MKRKQPWTVVVKMEHQAVEESSPACSVMQTTPSAPAGENFKTEKAVCVQMERPTEIPTSSSTYSMVMETTPSSECVT
ncbi:hypothetical protein V1264_005777 [Littorina saxatilis]|uniref:Uncharacterized protein n=1 Tax=Littorina saxatilis TaxID=31220 RepID=A0AAN9B066_9CAEN